MWLCDQGATRTFLENDPPENPRLRRWYVYLCQLPIAIYHVPGIRNELSDYISRHHFDELVQGEFEEMAQGARQRMDTHLDLTMKATFAGLPRWVWDDYQTYFP